MIKKIISLGLLLFIFSIIGSVLNIFFDNVVLNISTVFFFFGIIVWIIVIVSKLILGNTFGLGYIIWKLKRDKIVWNML